MAPRSRHDHSRAADQIRYAWNAARRSASARSSRRVAASSRSNGSSSIRPSRVLPRAGDRAVDEERRRGVRVAHVEDLRPVLLGQDPRAAGVDEQRRVPRRQEADRDGLLGIGQRRARDVEQLVAGLGAKAAQAHGARGPARGRAAPGRCTRRCRRARPGRSRRGSCARAAPPASAALRSGGGPTQSSAAAKRSARRRSQVPGRRHADEVDPLADADRVRLADERVELLAADRLAGLREVLAHARGELASSAPRRCRRACCAATARAAPRAWRARTARSRAWRRGGS